MNTAENSKKPYLLEVLRGEKRFNPIRLIQYFAEKMRVRAGTIFRRKKGSLRPSATESR